MAHDTGCGLAQPIDERRELPVKLEIRQGGHLLAQVQEAADDVESVERALERKVCVDAVENLGQGIQDVEPLAPGERGHRGTHGALHGTHW